MIKISRRLLLLFLVVFATFGLAACAEAEPVVGPRGPKGSPGVAGAQGPAGVAGPAGEDGADGEDGAAGKSAYDLYKELYPKYPGTASVWLDDLIKGKLLVTFEYTLGMGDFPLTVEPAYEEGEEYEFKKGQTLTALPEPFIDGYDFFGWYSDAAFTKPFSFDTGAIANTMVYARYIMKTYKTNNGIVAALAATPASNVIVKGIVTNIPVANVYIIQEKTATTENALFVISQNDALKHVKVGDEVILNGVRNTLDGLNHVVVNNSTNVYITGTGKAVPIATKVVLPAVVAEVHQGMRVTFASGTPAVNVQFDIVSITETGSVLVVVVKDPLNVNYTLVVDATGRTDLERVSNYIQTILKPMDKVSLNNLTVGWSNGVRFHITASSQIILEVAYVPAP